MRFLVFAVAALFAVAVVRAAWIGDDALITMRVVDNFVHGDGMRWNIADRVQISIHPLWMLVVSAVYAVWRDPYWAMMLPSLACMVGATWLLIRSARSLGAATLALACLVASKALCDYSTSGLENPLTMLLLVVALRLTEDAATSRRSFQRLCIVTGLIVLNRFDQALVVLPLWIAFGIRHPWRWALTAMLVGMLPLLAWLAFATFYFGTPLPIIGHAKLLSLGVGPSQLAAQAVRYFVDSWQRDPVTLVVITCGIVIAAVQRTRTSLAVVAAVLFCCAYIFRVGGDFMSGRFFVTPLFLVALVVARLPWLDAWRPRRVALCVSAILGAGFLSRPPTLLSPISDYVSVNTVHGVVCERAH
ncbi:MAG TPA: hypothetical protein PKE00_04075, partial [Planctomycetota bacterium]|nr:hypothetical protein [Planctomycetota bacterium]